MELPQLRLISRKVPWGSSNFSVLGDCKKPNFWFYQVLKVSHISRSRRHWNPYPPEVHQIPGETEHMLSLKKCRSLTNLPDGTGKLRSLQFLDLSHCDSEVNSFSQGFETMKVLRMRGTFIQEFPEDVLNMEKLEEIDFSLCRSLRGEIHCGIERLSSLAILKLSDAQISGMPASISRLSSLPVLDISGFDNLESPLELQMIIRF